MHEELELLEIQITDFYEACLRVFRFIVGKKNITKFGNYVKRQPLGKRFLLKLAISCIGAVCFCAIILLGILIALLLDMPLP